MANWSPWQNVIGSSPRAVGTPSLGGIVGIGGSQAFMNARVVQPAVTNAQRLRRAQGGRFRLTNNMASFECHYQFISMAAWALSGATPVAANYTTGVGRRAWELRLFVSTHDTPCGQNPPNNSWQLIGSRVLREMGRSTTFTCGQPNTIALLYPNGQAGFTQFARCGSENWENATNWGQPSGVPAPWGGRHAWVENTVSFNVPANIRDTWTHFRVNLTLTGADGEEVPDIDLIECREILDEEYRPMATRATQGAIMRSLNNAGGFLDTRNANGNWTPMALMNESEIGLANTGASSQTRSGSTWVQQGWIGARD